MEGDEPLGGRATKRLAAGCWIAGASIYLAAERAAAVAFSPSYSYAQNYISDLGVPDCGIVFDDRAICSPLHGLVNGGFIVQGLLFLGAALAVTWSISTPTKFGLIAFAALNCAGNGLIALVPENVPVQLAGGLGYHVFGALLAIVFGNATILMSAWTFRELRWPRAHRYASIALPLLALVALVMLAWTSGPTEWLPDGVWERISVYTITSWQLLSAACVWMGRDTDRPPRTDVLPRPFGRET